MIPQFPHFLRSKGAPALLAIFLCVACASAPLRDAASREGLQTRLTAEWPNNELVRLVFHGHSVPAGYFRAPTVERLAAYPTLVHRELCAAYPTATIDLANVAIGGEQSEQGAGRFDGDVLALRPDVIVIDYGLNDRSIGLKRAEASWRSMIERGLRAGALIVLVTPTPDTREAFADADAPLTRHARMIRRLAGEYSVPLADAHSAFERTLSGGTGLGDLMVTANHPNAAGHQLVAAQVVQVLRAGS